MSDNVRYHSKHHSRAHHTIPTEGYFDSGIDPLASEESPYLGSFWLSGGNIYTYNMYMSSEDAGSTWFDISTRLVSDYALEPIWTGTYSTVNANSGLWSATGAAADGFSETFTGNGSEKRFESTYELASGANVIVTIGGVVQTPVHFDDLSTGHYALSANAARGGKADLCFSTAPANTEPIEVRHFHFIKGSDIVNNYTTQNTGNITNVAHGNTNYVQFNSGSQGFGSSDQLVWDISNSRLGIGTNDPACTLDVDGHICISPTTGNANLTFTGGGSHAQIIQFNDYDLRILTNNTERMVVKNDGKVGIGTVGTGGPDSALHVVGKIIGDSSGDDIHTLTRKTVTYDNLGQVLGLAHNTTGTPANGMGSRMAFLAETSTTESETQVIFDAIWTDVTHASRTSDFAIRLLDGAVQTEKFRFTGAGELGIGTTGPDGLLHLDRATTSIASPHIRLTDTGDAREASIVNQSGDLILATHGTDNAADGQIMIHEGGAIFFSTGSDGATDVKIDTDGNVGIGTGAPGATLTVAGTVSANSATHQHEVLGISVSDETSDIATGTPITTFRMPYAMTLTEVRANVNTAPVGSTIIVDINEGGSTILSTKLTIDASEKTSTTAAAPAVISDAALADDAEITIDIDQVGSSTAGKGLKIWLVGRRA